MRSNCALTPSRQSVSYKSVCKRIFALPLYEPGYRVFPNNALVEMAKILNVHYIHFVSITLGRVKDIMLTFLWLDEDDRSTIHLFRLDRNPGKCNASDDRLVRYYDNDDWPASSSIDEKGPDKENNSYQWRAK